MDRIGRSTGAGSLEAMSVDKEFARYEQGEDDVHTDREGVVDYAEGAGDLRVEGESGLGRLEDPNRSYGE